MKLEGFIIKETEVQNAIILCYKDYDMAKNVYEKLREQKDKGFMLNRVLLRFIWSPQEEYQCKIAVEFVNRNKNVYVNPPMLPFEGTDLDEFEERTFLDSVDIKDCHIIYSGDVPKIK